MKRLNRSTRRAERKANSLRLRDLLFKVCAVGCVPFGFPPHNAIIQTMVMLNAHFDGKTIVIDEPVSMPLKAGARLKINVELLDEPKRADARNGHFQPLDIAIDPALSNAIALDPEFNIED